MADPRFRLDAGTADRVLEGRVPPDDAPPGYAEVAGLLQTLAADLPSRPAAAGEGTIRMMAKVVGISDPPKPAGGRIRSRPIVALAMVVSLGTTGVAFAGGLPDAAHRVVSTDPDDPDGGDSATGTSIADAQAGQSPGSADAGSDSSADAALTTRAGAPPDPETP